VRIGCAFDHAGVPLRDVVLDAVRGAGHEPVDLGTADDYPDVALAVGRAVAGGDVERGILVCGSGAGVSVAACKLPGIRACTTHEPYTGAQCVEHDDCNVACLGARVVGPALAAMIVRAFAGASFTGEERPVRRVGKVLALERDGLDTDFERGDFTTWREP
jgi:ribose 5-phosphate isomerase B